MSRPQGKPEGTSPSLLFPFVNVRTDGKPKQRHAKEISFILSLLKSAGICRLKADHIYDIGYDREIPISKNGKVYDIGYVSHDGETFLIEIMRVTYKKKKG